MSVLNAIFMAILQAISAILPTSELGHIALFNNFASRSQNSFSQINGWIEIGIALGIVIALYKPFISLIAEFISTLKEMFKSREKLKKPTPERKFFYMTLISLAFPILWSIPVGKDINLYQLLSSLNFDGNVFSEGLFFILMSVLLFTTFMTTSKNIKTKANKNVSIIGAILFGVTLLVSIPVAGLSYVVTGMMILALFSVSPKLSFRYTFVLSVPMLIINGIINISSSINMDNAITVIIGIVVSAIVSFFAVKFSRYIFIKNKTDKLALYNLSIGVIAAFIGFIQIVIK